MKHSNNYGKYHAPDCTCTYNFTCRACLDNAPKYFWTPNKPAEPSNKSKS